METMRSIVGMEAGVGAARTASGPHPAGLTAVHPLRKGEGGRLGLKTCAN